MDTSRGFLSGTVDKFKMVKISIRKSAAALPFFLLLFSTRTSLDRFLRQNQVAEWLPWWRPSLLSSCSYTTWPNRCIPWSFVSVARSCCLRRTNVYHYVCLIMWSAFCAVDDLNISRSSRIVDHNAEVQLVSRTVSPDTLGDVLKPWTWRCDDICPCWCCHTCAKFFASLQGCNGKIRIRCALFFLLGNSMHGIRLICQGEMLSVLARCCLVPLRRKWDAKCQTVVVFCCVAFTVMATRRPVETVYVPNPTTPNRTPTSTLLLLL